MLIILRFQVPKLYVCLHRNLQQLREAREGFVTEKETLTASELEMNKNLTGPDRKENRGHSFKWRLQQIRSSLRASFDATKRATSSSVKDKTFTDCKDSESKRNRTKSAGRNSRAIAYSNPVFDSFKPTRGNKAQNKHDLSKLERDNEVLSTTNGNLLSEKTSLDGCTLDKQKPEDAKRWSNNKVICNENVVGFQKQSRDSKAANGQITTEESKQGGQKAASGRENTNTQTSIVRAKSLSKLASLFKRSCSSDKDKNERGKKLPSASSEASQKNTLSPTTSANLETLRTAYSSSTLDSFSDSDCYLDRDYKYRSLKRSKASLIYPYSIQRSFSLATSLATFDANMGEKSRTLACITPSIHVEEFFDNSTVRCSSSVEIHNGSSSCSVSIHAGKLFRSDTYCCANLGSCENCVSCKSSFRVDAYSNIGRDAANCSHQRTEHVSYPGAQRNKSDIHVCGHQRIRDDIGLEVGDFVATAEIGSQTDFLDESNSDSTMGNISSSWRLSTERLSRSGSCRLFKSSTGLSFIKPSSKGDSNDDEWRSSTCVESVDGLVEEHGRRRIGNFHTGQRGLCEKCELALRESPTRQNQDQDRDPKVESIIPLPDGFINHGDTLFCKEIPTDKCGTGMSGCVNISERVYSRNTEYLVEGQTSGSAGQSALSHCLSCMPKGPRQSPNSCEECLKCTNVDVCCKDVPNVSLNLSQELRDHVTQSSHRTLQRAIAMETGNELCPGPHLSESHSCSCGGPVQELGGQTNGAGDINEDEGLPHLQPLCFNGRNGECSYCQCCGESLPSSLEDNVRTPGSKYQFAMSPESPTCESSTLQVLSQRQRSRSAHTSPVMSQLHNYFLEENRSCSCTQLNERGNLSSTSPPQVRPRIQSLEELPAVTTQIIMRKKRNFMEKTRIKHANSLDLPSMDEALYKFNQGKRHSYGGAGDALPLAFMFLRSRSAEGQLDICSDSMQSIDTSKSSLCHSSEFGSFLSLSSNTLGVDHFDVSLGRSRSVPGFLGVSDIPQTSPIPEERERHASQASLQSMMSSESLPFRPIPLENGTNLEDYEVRISDYAVLFLYMSSINNHNNDVLFVVLLCHLQ